MKENSVVLVLAVVLLIVGCAALAAHDVLSAALLLYGAWYLEKRSRATGRRW